MKLNQPKFLPLYLTLIGSCLLAIPGGVGGVFVAADAINYIGRITLETKNYDFLVLLMPIPAIIGFLLLFGYIWTAWSKKFIKWFWLISMVFNLLITFVSEFFIVKMNYETINFTRKSDALLRLSFLLFPLWTLFVAVVSAKYAFFSSTNEDLHLP